MPPERDPETGKFVSPQERLEQTLRELDDGKSLLSLDDDDDAPEVQDEVDEVSEAGSVVEAGQASPEPVDDSAAEQADAQPEVTPAPVAEQPAPTQPAEPTWWQRDGFANEHDVRRSLLQSQWELDQMRNVFAQQQSEQQRQAAEAAKPAPFAPPTEPRGWQNYVVTDEKGNKNWSPSTPAEVLDGYQRWQAYQQFNESVKPFAEPFFQQALNPYAEQLQKLEARVQEYERQRMLDTIRPHSVWMFEQDANGRPQYDPNTLNGKLSPAGEMFQQSLLRHQANPDPNARVEAALNEVQAHFSKLAIERENAELKARLAALEQQAKPTAEATPTTPKQNQAARRQQTRELAAVGAGIGTEHANGEGISAHDFIANRLGGMGFDKNSTVADFFGHDDD